MRIKGIFYLSTQYELSVYFFVSEKSVIFAPAKIKLLQRRTKRGPAVPSFIRQKKG